MTNTKLASGRCEISQTMEKAHEIAAARMENKDWTRDTAVDFLEKVNWDQEEWAGLVDEWHGKYC